MSLKNYEKINQWDFFRHFLFTLFWPVNFWLVGGPNKNPNKKISSLDSLIIIRSTRYSRCFQTVTTQRNIVLKNCVFRICVNRKNYFILFNVLPRYFTNKNYGDDLYHSEVLICASLVPTIIELTFEFIYKV